MILASSIFLITLLFVIWQTKSLQIGTTAVTGSVAALVLGIILLFVSRLHVLSKKGVKIGF